MHSMPDPDSPIGQRRLLSCRRRAWNRRDRDCLLVGMAVGLFQHAERRFAAQIAPLGWGLVATGPLLVALVVMSVSDRAAAPTS